MILITIYIFRTGLFPASQENSHAWVREQEENRRLT